MASCWSCSSTIDALTVGAHGHVGGGVQWGQIMLERPYFQQPGQAPHPHDEYTHESVRRELERLLQVSRSRSSTIDEPTWRR
jgi:hypothetical protein